MSIPGAGSTASLYYTDPEYDELADLVGVAEPSGTFGGTESGSGHEFGPGVTVTWLVHDVEPWRVDRIYLGGKDGPWISTQVSDFSELDLGEPRAVAPPRGRRRSRRPARRPGTGHQGVEGHLLRRRRRRTPSAPESGSAAHEPAAVQPKAAAPSGQAWYASAGWAIGGLVAGVLIALAWARRRSTSDDEPEPALGVADGYAEVLVR